MTTKIEWTDATWNPIRARRRSDGKVGWHCVKVSDACRHCYAEKQNVVAGTNRGRHGNGVPYAVDKLPLVESFLDWRTLYQPLHWKHGRKIFPGSMTDLYGAWVPDHWLDLIYAVMALTPQHFYIVLTKRSERRRNYLSAPWTFVRVMKEVKDKAVTQAEVDRVKWPLLNVIEMASFGRQKDADTELPFLLQTPAAMRGASVEPQLETIDISRYLLCFNCMGRDLVACDGTHDCLGQPLHWIIDGGESGSQARPFEISWANDLRIQCHEARVAFFMKQWGTNACSAGDSLAYRDPKGGDPSEWPEHLRVREWPEVATR